MGRGTERRAARQIACSECPLRRLATFRDFSRSELAFVADFKKGELSVDRGASLLIEGAHNPHLYTVLSGWGFRYKMLVDGRRQIVNYIMPGDLVGLQGSLMGEMAHSVEALSPMVLCVFERDHLMSLFREYPTLAYDITWIASREESMLDENLLTVGRRSALERVAYLIAFLASRADSAGLVGRNDLGIPITQQHVADTLGLSLVHTNKTIRKLINQDMLSWGDGNCTVLDRKALHRLAKWRDEERLPRPFI